MALKLHTAEEDGVQEKQFIQVPFEIKEMEENEETHIVEFKGHAASFNNLDHGRDVILPGAFAKTIKKDGVTWPILHMHNSYEQMGWNAEAAEDKKGLAVLGELNLEVQRAKEQYSLSKQAKARGGKMGLSIGYRPIVWEIDQAKRIRNLIEVKMFEYSFVVWPMNPKATVSQIKTMFDAGFMAEEGIQDFKEICGSARLLEKVLREVGFSTSKAAALANVGVRVNKGQSLREVGLVPETPTEMKQACVSMQELILSLKEA